jgi:hypothetical protein
MLAIITFSDYVMWSWLCVVSRRLHIAHSQNALMSYVLVASSFAKHVDRIGDRL